MRLSNNLVKRQKKNLHLSMIADASKGQKACSSTHLQIGKMNLNENQKNL